MAELLPRETEDGNYYIIPCPKHKNSKTGNRSFSKQCFLEGQEKDFKVEEKRVDGGYFLTDPIPREYVLKHSKFTRKVRVEQPDGSVIYLEGSDHPYCLISYKKLDEFFHPENYVRKNKRAKDTGGPTLGVSEIEDSNSYPLC